MLLQGNIVKQNNMHNNTTLREHIKAKLNALSYHFKGTLYGKLICIIILLQGNTIKQNNMHTHIISLQGHTLGLHQNNHIHFLRVLVITHNYQFSARRLNERCL